MAGLRGWCGLPRVPRPIAEQDWFTRARWPTSTSRSTTARVSCARGNWSMTTGGRLTAVTLDEVEQRLDQIRDNLFRYDAKNRVADASPGRTPSVMIYFVGGTMPRWQAVEP